SPACIAWRRSWAWRWRCSSSRSSTSASCSAASRCRRRPRARSRISAPRTMDTSPSIDRRRRVARPAGLLALLVALVLAAGFAGRAAAEQRMALAARAFLASLDDATRARARLPFDDAARKDWQFVPRDRKGLSLGEMNDAQRAAARALIESGLSAQ